MRISDWSSDVCSSDLASNPPAQALHCRRIGGGREAAALVRHSSEAYRQRRRQGEEGRAEAEKFFSSAGLSLSAIPWTIGTFPKWLGSGRSEEHTSELQSLMRISYAVFCLNKKKNKYQHNRIS